LVDDTEIRDEGRETGPLLFGMSRGPLIRLVVGVLLIAVATWAWWDRRSVPTLHDVAGFTMGSTWSARVVGPANLNAVALRAQIDEQLGELDRQLSNYRDTAELAMLNRAEVGGWRPVPPHLAAVIRFGQRLHDESGGAFDLTVKPLVNLWGFGSAERRTTLPTDAEVAAARARLGSDRIEFSSDGTRIRRAADVQIDVDAIAPGYAADVIAAWLTARGWPNHLVEVGGELRAEGHRPDGSVWQVGVERPTLERAGVEQVIAVTDCGVATSGDYRAFESVNGKRYSHTIDPATGRPVDHGLVSVTVVAATGMQADGYATAIMVLGPERGLDWANAHGIAVYMLLRDGGGALKERYNAAFAPYLAAN
jgi:thiamine biosynthesis lipoprotein